MKKVLIANRAEIARRIIKTCKRLNIETVAIYSEADEFLPYVSEADYAFLIGQSPVQQSYLKMDEIIDLALREGVDAIHPGYGLLSENYLFAEKVKEAGLLFIGPDATTIKMMGDKIASRNSMKAAGVPVVLGTDEGVHSLEDAINAANVIGYPIILKASAGGGGVGMIRCDDEHSLVSQFESVKNRAKTYFGNDIVFIEKYITFARHIEVQVFGDHAGNIVHLFERNCSVQRRNQKVIEESPSPHLPREVREAMLKTAVAAAKAVSYKNAGTVEFIVDGENNFYFLEMNTRLQVEHPVTEAVTGIDLVEWQLKVAAGEELPINDQSLIELKGHAIEYRIYAEDPVTLYPSPGTIQTLSWGEHPHMRVDSGYEEGNKVTPFYDPMISKVIIHENTREQAIETSKEVLKMAQIEGLKTNLTLVTGFIDSHEFMTGDYSTAVLLDWLNKNKGEN